MILEETRISGACLEGSEAFREIKDTESTLEAWSNHNLVLFYGEELRQLSEGGEVREIFTPSERRNLRKYGILRYETNRGNSHNSRRMKIAEEALKLLDRVPCQAAHVRRARGRDTGV